METVQVESSSEEDDDVYLNSVAKLKALKKQKALGPNKEKEDETKEEETIEPLNIEVPKETAVPQITTRATRGNRNKSGPRITRQIQRRTHDEDLDLEIVSVKGIVPVAETPQSPENDLIIHEKSVDSSEDENYDIDIKILWRSKNVHRLNIRRNENFRKIFEHFANLEQVPIDEILLTKKDRTIKKSDTPASINLSVIDILEGGIVKKGSTVAQKNAEGKLDEDVCIIKVQTTSKKSLTVTVDRDEDFKGLLAKCVQELNVEEWKIKLYFDGEIVAITDTPDSLEIEDEACFDLRISS
ncbi:DNA repair protein Rad60 [Andrena cerasifolii]|uniref:DNA repair protein Rad60 n=1 Tax=Andrena cerasifolii TaxID=2819439 RepID=UPI0040379A29